jgi:hypothetical protein
MAPCEVIQLNTVETNFGQIYVYRKLRKLGGKDVDVQGVRAPILRQTA